MNSTNKETCLFLEVLHLVKLTPSIYYTALFTSIINGVTSVFATIGNAMLLIIFVRTDQLQTPSNVLLASLSLTDLIVGLIVQPLSIARRVYESRNHNICTARIVYAYFGFLCSGASFLNIGLISIDRCIAINFPFLYSRSASNRVHLTIVIIVWIFWAVFTLLPFLNVLSVGDFFTAVVVTLGLNAFIVIVSYAIIFRVIWLQKRKIYSNASLGVIENETRTSRLASVARHEPSRSPTDSPISRKCSSLTGDHSPAVEARFPSGQNSMQVSPSNLSPVLNRSSVEHSCSHDGALPTARGMERNKSEKRKTYTIAIVVLCMIVCYLPQLTVLQLRGVFGDDIGLVFIADAWVDTITFINSSLNPIIYCFRLKEIRHYLFKMLGLAGKPELERRGHQQTLNMGDISPVPVRY